MVLPGCGISRLGAQKIHDNFERIQNESFSSGDFCSDDDEITIQDIRINIDDEKKNHRRSSQGVRKFSVHGRSRIGLNSNPMEISPYKKKSRVEVDNVDDPSDDKTPLFINIQAVRRDTMSAVVDKKKDVKK